MPVSKRNKTARIRDKNARLLGHKIASKDDQNLTDYPSLLTNIINHCCSDNANKGNTLFQVLKLEH